MCLDTTVFFVGEINKKMKALLRAQEARTGRRNLIGRRMINTLLKAGGFIEPYTGMFSRKMEQIQEIASAGSDMSSKHGRLFTGVLDKIPVVVKIPKSPEAIRGWNRELTLTNEMAQAGIAPEVYVQSSHPDQFMIMKRYDIDVLNRMVDILESDVTPDEKIEQAGKVKAAVESLINRIVAYHKNHPRTPVCFGDFRMENIVIGKNEKGKIETRQIDFDKAFCASKSKLPNVDLKLLLMLCVTFSYNDGNQKFMKQLFPPSGRNSWRSSQKEQKRCAICWNCSIHWKGNGYGRGDSKKVCTEYEKSSYESRGGLDGKREPSIPKKLKKKSIPKS